MSGWDITFAFLGIIVAPGGGLLAWIYLRPKLRQMRADAKKTEVEAAAAEESADDEHLKTVVQFLVEPLKNRVEELENDLSELRLEFRATRKKYLRLVDWARDVLTWARVWHPDAHPPLPPLPAEVLDDL